MLMVNKLILFNKLINRLIKIYINIQYILID